MTGEAGADHLGVVGLARLQAEIYWSHYFGITVGYRRVKIDAKVESSGKANFNQKGPYAGFIIRF